MADRAGEQDSAQNPMADSYEAARRIAGVEIESAEMPEKESLQIRRSGREGGRKEAARPSLVRCLGVSQQESPEIS